MLPEILLVLLTSLNWYSKTTTLPKLYLVLYNSPKATPIDIRFRFGCRDKALKMVLENKRQLRRSAEDLRDTAVFRGYWPSGSLVRKKIRFEIWSKGVCVPNFRSVQFFVWPGGVLHPYTSENRICSTGCSPPVDFDNTTMITSWNIEQFSTNF